MKKIYIPFAIILATALAVSSCSKKLDDVNPDTSLRLETITDSDIPLIINGAYVALTNNNYVDYYYQHDLMSDDLQSLPFFPFEINKIPVNDGVVGAYFQSLYKAIANLNIAIRYAEDKSTPSVKAASGEAKFLRGYCYLKLVQNFGGVPIRYGTESAGDKPSRNTAEEVYTLVIRDLKEAIATLPDFVPGTSFKPSKQAAQALLARTYLETGAYALAKTEAQNVINSAKLSLELNYSSDMYSYASTCPENIFRIGEAGTTSNSGLGLFYGVVGIFWLDDNLASSFEPTDQRLSCIQSRPNPFIGMDAYYNLKFPVEQKHAYPILRYSEQFLIIAEADARLGQVDVTRYNELRSARGATTKLKSDFSTPAAFLEEIEKERRREFVGESMRWQDMRRFGKAIPFLQSKGQPAGYVLLPIPEREISLNPLMKQNPNY